MEGNARGMDMLAPGLLELAYPQCRNMICLYQEESWYWLSGVAFREFLLGIERPVHLLLLKHNCRWVATDDSHTRLEFLEEDNLNALLQDDVSGYGDFWWLDFCSLESLAQLRGQEFLELLYLKQLGKPLTSPHFPTLQNHLAYFGHDDGWSLHLSVDAPERLGSILAQVLTLKYAVFSGRRSFPRPNEAMANDLVARAKEGLLLDFRGVDAHATTVPIYAIGAATNLDAARQLGDAYIQSNPGKERLIVADDEWRHERGG